MKKPEARESSAPLFAAACGLDFCGVAAMSVDGQLVATPLNRYADELLASADGLTLENGKLAFAYSASRRLLQAAVDVALLASDGTAAALAIERDAGSRPLCCLLMRFPPTGTGPRRASHGPRPSSSSPTPTGSPRQIRITWAAGSI